MLIDFLNQDVDNRLSWAARVGEAYDVEVNALTVDSLFDLYRRAGFLYAAKAARLLPYMDLVKENWRRMLQAGDSLLYVLTAGSEEKGQASIAVWRTTGRAWVSQHLVSENNPLGSRAVMLAGSAGALLRGLDESHQNWFRPENRFPARVFGSMVQSIGESYASVRRHMYFALPRHKSFEANDSVHVVPYDSSHQEALCGLAALVRGNMYVNSEELKHDVELHYVNDLYRGVGLRRTRQTWLAYRDSKDEPIGAVMAYRGPLGINFSFIENRCDLLLHPAVAESDVPTIVGSLMNAARAAYTDFELNEIPVIADQMAASALTELGAEFLRSYCHGIWLQRGQSHFYEHVDHFYTRLLQRAERQNVERSITV
ncbi:MAG TPA: hypothetical protein VGK48_05610 [Terriglobia bacterium]|jgi:hypothetical protein